MAAFVWNLPPLKIPQEQELLGKFHVQNLFSTHSIHLNRHWKESSHEKWRGSLLQTQPSQVHRYVGPCATEKKDVQVIHSLFNWTHIITPVNIEDAGSLKFWKRILDLHANNACICGWHYCPCLLRILITCNELHRNDDLVSPFLDSIHLQIQVSGRSFC